MFIFNSTSTKAYTFIQHTSMWCVRCHQWILRHQPPVYTILWSSWSLYNQRPFKRFQNIVSTKVQQLCDSFVSKFRMNEYSPASFVLGSIRTTMVLLLRKYMDERRWTHFHLKWRHTSTIAFIPMTLLKAFLNIIGKQTKAQLDDYQLVDLICNHALILHSLQNTGK